MDDAIYDALGVSAAIDFAVPDWCCESHFRNLQRCESGFRNTPFAVTPHSEDEMREEGVSLAR
ncbi:hypothetical protein ACIA2T_36920, partial [Amycolatopsis japonica]